MLKILSARVVLVLAMALALFGAAFVGSANAAESTSCTVTDGFLTHTSCKTGTIHANRTSHRINYRVCAATKHYADWQIKDAHNGVIVAQGRVQDRVCSSGSVPGLYGDYWSWVFNTRAGASINIGN